MTTQRDSRRRRATFLAAATALVCGVAIAASRPSSHEASFTMMVGLKPGEPFQLDVQRTTLLVRTHAELIRSTPVLRNVALALAGATPPSETDLAAAVAQLRRAISAGSPPFTNLVTVTIRDRDERRTLQIATVLAAEYQRWWAGLTAGEHLIVLSPPEGSARASIDPGTWVSYAGIGLMSTALLLGCWRG